MLRALIHGIIVAIVVYLVGGLLLIFDTELLQDIGGFLQGAAPLVGLVAGLVSYFGRPDRV